LGGSLGARNINNAALGMAKRFINNKEIKTILITGQKQYEEVKNSIDLSSYKNVEIMPYSDEMPVLLNACDIVICRGGATTLFENMMTATPGVYIPYPYASNDHQRKNIEYITSRGGGVMILDKDLNEYTLYSEVSEIIFDDAKRKAMSKNAKAAAVADVLDKIYDEILKLTKSK
jgi:UDP-N-acetylglucosamine--N-acetylmuramyl-(pentapeptide) pyrophosphoryl-undecaprenol N-acetylglucosamine transferase